MKLFIILINIILAGGAVYAMEPSEEELSKSHFHSEDGSYAEPFGQRPADKIFEMHQAIYDADLVAFKELVSKTSMPCWYAGLFEDATRGHLDFLKYLYSLSSYKITLPDQGELDQLFTIAVKGGRRGISQFLLTGIPGVVSNDHFSNGIATAPSAEKIEELRKYIRVLEVKAEDASIAYNKGKMLELLNAHVLSSASSFPAEFYMP